MKAPLRLLLGHGTIPADTKEAGSADVHFVGKIDTRLIETQWRGVKETVVLTQERIAHILEGHQADYEAYGLWMGTIIESPSYILADRKNENTALYIGPARDATATVVIRLAFYAGSGDSQSSVITMFRIGEKRLKRLLKTSLVVYKKV